MRRFVNAVVILVFVALWQPAEAAAPRVALVIGNSDYADAPLANPANDARLMASVLRDLGFHVIERIDVDRETMQLAAFELQDRLLDAGKDAVGLFYYAGHGVQVGGQNYLIPLNTDIEFEREVAIKAVSAGFVLEQMEFAGNRMNFVILDACRNNPLTRRFRSETRGLARMDAPHGSLIAYSTGPGEVAADGSGANSPYTLALSEAIRTPGIAAEKMFKLVRNSVMSATGGQQTPWEESSLIGADFFFVPTDPTPIETVGDTGENERLFWESIKDSRNVADFDAYLQIFPDGVFAGLARNRLNELDAVAEAKITAAAAETRRLAEEDEARQQAETEAQRLAAEEEAKRQAEAEAQRLAAEEEAKRQAEAEAQRLAAAEEARRQAEAQRLAVEEEARRQAEAEARRLAEEDEARQQAEAEETAPDQVAVLETEAAAASQATAEIPDSFDGDWIAVVSERTYVPSPTRKIVTIIDNAFSWSFRQGRWNATVSGTIDQLGHVMGEGFIRRAGFARSFTFTARYRDGAIVVQIYNPAGKEIPVRWQISVSRAFPGATAGQD